MSAAQRVETGPRQDPNATGLFDLYRPGTGFVMVQAGHGVAADGESLSIDVEPGPHQVQPVEWKTFVEFLGKYFK